MQNNEKGFEMLEARLTDSEKDNLFHFCQNEGMVHAVEKAILYSLYEMGTVKESDKDMSKVDVNWAYAIPFTDSNLEAYGKAVRVKVEGLTMLGDAIQQIKKFGEVKIIQAAEINPALGK